MTTGLTAVASAQDAHYWTDQFGNRARLLGGAVVGSARDLSATYYNPGGLALVPTAEILLAGNVLNHTRYDVITGPQQQKLSSSNFGLSPSLFAGEVPSNVVGNNRVAYSFLTRQETDLRLQGRGGFTGHEFNERVTAYGSFRTNFSGVDPDSDTVVPIADWDIYHIAGGTTLTAGRSEFTLGAIVAKGDTTGSGIFEPPGEVAPPDQEQVTLEYFRISLILGFNFSFD